MLRNLLPVVLAASRLPAAVNVTFTPSVASPQPVGTTIVWTASGTDTDPGIIDYQFSVSSNSQPLRVFQDYDVSNVFEWTPSFREGFFSIQVVARNITTRNTATMAVPFTITSRVEPAGGQPLITPTANPLVALYSAPGCPTGSFVRVRFSNDSTVQRTGILPCSPAASTNLYVAGMLPSTTYNMSYQIVTGAQVTTGPVLPFTTGVPDPGLAFPAISVPIDGATATKQSALLINALTFTPPDVYVPFATDLSGRVIWYYNLPQQRPYNIRPVSGGTMLLLMSDPGRPSLAQQIFREIDLAGNTIRQTSVQRVSQQLKALGKYPIVSFSHEAIRLANGHTILLAAQEKMYPAGTQGSAEPVDILGNAIIDLNQNLQVAWSWSAFDHLDINRPATLGETCLAGHVYTCPPVRLASVANDWVHANSLNYVPADGSLILSSRHQDLIYKIDYGSGQGTGNVIWRLGLGGDFTVTGTEDPYPWFSHQHQAEFQPGGLLTVYDNGNTRVAQNPGQNSRGQAWIIDEEGMTANLTLNADLGVFSVAVGSAQLLGNGNYHFNSGWIATGPSTASAKSVETLPNGSIIYELTNSTINYRTYRMSTLYSIP